MSNFSKSLSSTFSLSSLSLAIVFALTAANAPSAMSLANAANPSELKVLVEKLDDIPASCRSQVEVSINAKRLNICLVKDSAASETDAKIDAVLITRKVISQVPESINTVTVRFRDAADHQSFIEIGVKASLVTAYACGKISGPSLLNSLAVTHSASKDSLKSKYAKSTYKRILAEESVQEGPLADQRLALLLRLRELTANGVDLAKYRGRFLKIEDLVRRRMVSGLSSEIAQLNQDLDNLCEQLVASGLLAAPSKADSLRAQALEGVKDAGAKDAQR